MWSGDLVKHGKCVSTIILWEFTMHNEWILYKHSELKLSLVQLHAQTPSEHSELVKILKYRLFLVMDGVTLKNVIMKYVPDGWYRKVSDSIPDQ